jgi:arylsulfatase A-like enzyme
MPKLVLIVLQVRMPSGMQGAKKTVMEGGVRNFLAVRGPGVAQGVSSDALLGLVDITPTVVELAGITQVGFIYFEV